MTAQPAGFPPGPALRIAFVPGVTVRKWTRRWEERHPQIDYEVIPVAEGEGIAALRSERSTVSFVRLPVEREGLSVVRLYGEVPVLLVPRDHELAALEAVPLERLADFTGVVDYPPRGPVADAVELVAAGVGLLRLPHSIARLNARKDVVAVPIEDAEETEVALAWLADETTETIEEFLGIVRGRTAASSRATPTPPTVKARPVRSPREAKPAHRDRNRSRQGRKRGGR
ncbi:MAG: LysR substrate-binding domain-containing protein [Galbitalea sp.]